MLVGIPIRPQLPILPALGSDLAAIHRYLQDLEQTINVYMSRIVSNAVGLVGVRGLSSSGVVSQNFIQGSLAIGGHTSLTWGFSNIETDASYMVFYSPSVSTGMVMVGQTRMTTGVAFTFNPAVPSGMLLDILLLR